MQRPPPSPEPPGQRSILIALSLGTAVYQAFTLWLNLPQHHLLLTVMAAVGVLISLGIAAHLALGGRVDHNRINRLALTIVGAWMVVHLVTGFLDPTQVDTSHYVTHLILVTIAFTVLRLPSALALSGGNFLLLTLLTLTRSPAHLELLNDVGFLTMVIAYLTVFGRRVRDHQTRTVEMANLARRDSLTDLLNRRAGQERLEELMGQSPHPAGAALVLLDLDHFKSLNDTYGHAAGDEALRRVAHILHSHSRQGDLVCRWGGEEFLLILEDVNPLDALTVAGRIQAEVRGMILPFPRRLTLSGGVAMLNEAYSLAELLALVDRRLYAAKNSGRDRIVAESQLFENLNAAPENAGPGRPGNGTLLDR